MENSPDIVGISETFLRENIQNSNLNINGFVFERKDRPHKLDGGLLVYIADHIDFKQRHDIEIEDLESIWLQITFPNNEPILLNFVYRPPSSNQIWIEKYEQQLISAESTNLDYTCILLGDYNLQYSTTSTYNNIKWAKVVLDFGLYQLIKSPTRVTNNSSSIIDHIYSTNEQAISEILVPKNVISDDYP